tara:strand:+ start:710 stop:964 length:255 start_codon:yes stop_codon:yes gene_type:complete
MRTLNELRAIQLEAKQKERKERLSEVAPEMLETLKSIEKIANDTMPSSAYLRHDSSQYNQDKVELYELCKAVLEKCNNILKGGE